MSIILFNIILFFLIYLDIHNDPFSFGLYHVQLIRVNYNTVDKDAERWTVPWHLPSLQVEVVRVCGLFFRKQCQMTFVPAD